MAVRKFFLADICKFKDSTEITFWDTLSAKIKKLW